MRKLDTSNKLLLLQGISLIEDGMQFLEWQECYLNSCSYDAFSVLRNRFEYFKECTFEDTKSGHLVIDRVRTKMNNLGYGYELVNKIKDELNDLRRITVEEQNKEK